MLAQEERSTFFQGTGQERGYVLNQCFRILVTMGQVKRTSRIWRKKHFLSYHTSKYKFCVYFSSVYKSFIGNVFRYIFKTINCLYIKICILY